MVEQIVQKVKEEDWAGAYVLYREKEQNLTPRERRLLKSPLERRAAGRSIWGKPVLLVLSALLLQLSTGAFFQSQIQDVFSFLGGIFRPYLYVATLVPVLISLCLGIRMVLLCYQRGILTSHLLQLTIPWREMIPLCSLGVLMCLLPLGRLVPLAMDLPMVLRQEYAVGIVTREREETYALNDAYMQMGKPLVGDYNPTAWFSRPRWPDWLMPYMPGLYNDWMREINVDDITFQISSLQFNLSGYESGKYPIYIEYLPNSQIILWILCGEEES
ncbi:MAG: hypothetical protein LUG13_08690 [Oscillospiraceae bacterium]|nr:hypothetical protein [Oscillospiraceae bacterium]